jgi:predicted NBD/HSP70 family sugar kinase
VLPDAGRALGRAIAAACLLLDPAVVVVGGDEAFAAEPVLAEIARALERGVAGVGGAARVVPAQQGARGPLIGALRLAARPQHGRSPVLAASR